MPYITLKCKHCDNIQCNVADLVNSIDFESGCTRFVTDEQAETFFHYIEERLPFIRNYKSKEYDTIILFLESIYNAPIGQIIDKQGRVAAKTNYRNPKEKG